MEIKWSVVDVTAVRSPDRADILGVVMPGQCFQALFVIGEPLCDVETPSWALVTLPKVTYLLKKEWLVTNETAVGSPDRAECGILEINLAGCFWPIQAAFVVEEPLCDVETPAWDLISLLRVA